MRFDEFVLTFLGIFIVLVYASYMTHLLGKIRSSKLKLRIFRNQAKAASRLPMDRKPRRSFVTRYYN